MVDYLLVGSQEAPQTIIAKKKFSSPEILNHNPSPLCIDYWETFVSRFGSAALEAKKS